MLKFELSKQLFQEVGEDEETDDIDIGEGGKPDNESSNNKESDKDLFAKLFDYDHHQVETIASGDSQASKTLSRTSLAQLEREITARAAAASPHTEQLACSAPRSVIYSILQRTFVHLTRVGKVMATLNVI